MKDGYYWARWIEENGGWEIVEVLSGWVKTLGGETSCHERLKLYEFGDKIEVPCKYNTS